MSVYDEQRKNMVEGDVRPSDVTDRRVIRAMSTLPRELFVPEKNRFLAYSDQHVTIAEAGVEGPLRVLLSARLAARMIQALDLKETDLVLEVGTGTAYGAAVMARIAQTVVALECDAVLAKSAGETLVAHGVDNVAVVTGALPRGYPEEGPYDAILVSGLVNEVPESLLDQLKHGGRLVALVSAGEKLAQVVRWQRFGELFDQRVLFEASAPVLPGFEKAAQFVF